MFEDIRLKSDKGVDSLSCQLVGSSNDLGRNDQSQSWLGAVYAKRKLTSSFSNTLMHDQSRLDLSGRQTMARYVDNIYTTFVNVSAPNPKIELQGNRM